MKIDNKIENVFGRAPVFSGAVFLLVSVFLFVSGVFFPAIFACIASSFVLFSYSGVEIDTGKRKIRQYNKLFGIIKTGHWKSNHSYLGVTIIPFTKTDSVVSLSNQTTSFKETDYRIFLVSKARKPAFAIKKCKSVTEAQNSLDEFSLWLKLPVYSCKK